VMVDLERNWSIDFRQLGERSVPAGVH
jgi:hypothetical protein